MDSPEAVVAFDPDGQVLGQGVADLGVEIERERGGGRSGDLEVEVQVRGHGPAAEPVADDALQLGIPGVVVQGVRDPADLQVQAPEPGLPLGLWRDELDPALEPVRREPTLAVQGGQRQIEAELDVLGQAIGPLRRQAIAAQAGLLARIAGPRIAAGDIVVVQVQPKLPGLVHVVHIDLDLFVRGQGRDGQRDASR